MGGHTGENTKKEEVKCREFIKDHRSVCLGEFVLFCLLILTSAGLSSGCQPFTTLPVWIRCPPVMLQHHSLMSNTAFATLFVPLSPPLHSKGRDCVIKPCIPNQILCLRTICCEFT